MSSEVVISIIGIAGTILGTILGWFLSQLSQRGKLCIFVQNWHNTFSHINTSGCYTLSSSFDEASNYDFELEIDVYNSSNNTKIMRNLSINFFDGGSTILTYTPDDATTLQHHSYTIHYDKFSCVKIPAKSSTRLKLHGWLDLSKNRNLENVSSVTFNYIDSKNKPRTASIPFAKFSEHFAQLKEATPNA